jgi:hypothetical protein
VALGIPAVGDVVVAAAQPETRLIARATTTAMSGEATRRPPGLGEIMTESSKMECNLA